MPSQVLPILTAQLRTLRHFRRGGGAGLVLTALTLLIWYGLWTTLSLIALFLASNPDNGRALGLVLPKGLLFVALYWQLSPILTATLGASLDLRKLLVYPIAHRELFGVEVLLRLTTSAEMLLVVTGVTVGILRNPTLPGGMAPAAFFLFALFNLFLAAGLRNQLERWMARRRVRELMVLALVLTAALPQLLVVTGVPASVRRLLGSGSGGYWPWSATAGLAVGGPALAGFGVLLAWTAAAYFFGRWQFERSLRFDAAAVQSADRRPVRTGSWLDRIYRFPSVVLPDPIAAVAEKELRSLSRTPRFRLVFLMGFTFGIIVFLPMALQQMRTGGFSLPADYLAMVSAYALLLLGDVAFWNIFGLDRAATQVFFLLPVPVSRVLAGKNLAAAVFVVLEVTAITAVCKLVRMPLAPGKILEAYLVALILTLYLLGAGNLSSVYFPRPVNPEKSTGSGSSGRIRTLLLLIYPVAATPVLLAYGARYAFDSQAAFYAVLAFAAALGVAFYWIALESAASRAEQRKDRLLQVLSESEGPVSLT